MYPLPGGADALKHSLRGLKRLESKIRFGTSVPPAGRQLVWNTFFDLRGFASNTARYPLAVLCGMDALALQGVIDEYFFYVYYRYYRENGIAQAALYDPDLLKRFGLPADADRATVKSKFRELAMRYHPDHGGDPKQFMEMMEMYKKLTE